MWGLRYHYDVNNSWSLGAEVGYQHDETSQKVINTDTGAIRTIKKNTDAIMIMGLAKLNYYIGTNGAFEFYGNLYAGAIILRVNGNGRKLGVEGSSTTFSFQVNPIGLRYGNALSGMLELGFGMKGIFTLGIGYNF